MPLNPWKMYQERAQKVLDYLEQFFPNRLSDLCQNGELEQLYNVIAGARGMSMDDRIAYAEHYESLDSESRCVLAYLGGLMIADLYEGSWQDRIAFFCRARDINIPSAVTFAGWAGQNNDVGPSYRIRRDCFAQDRKLFYMDSDMADDIDEATARMHALQTSCSGLSDFKVEQMDVPIMLTGNLTEYRYSLAVTFRLDPAQARSVVIQGREVCPENGDGLLIVPKTCEYDLFIGEWVPNLYVSAYPPALIHECRHYCLK